MNLFFIIYLVHLQDVAEHLVHGDVTKNIFRVKAFLFPPELLL